jgi:hypothetical protein
MTEQGKKAAEMQIALKKEAIDHTALSHNLVVAFRRAVFTYIDNINGIQE